MMLKMFFTFQLVVLDLTANATIKANEQLLFEGPFQTARFRGAEPARTLAG